MRDLPLNALRAFAAVYESGGVRPAARELEITHSSVSRHLRELENWLGVELTRSRAGSRQIVLTAAGEALGRIALEALRELSTATAALREQRRGNAVSISTTPSVAARWLLSRIPSLQQAFPWIEVSVVAEQKIVDPGTHGADIALRMGRGPWPELDCEPLMDDALYPFVSRRLWPDPERQATPHALKRFTLLHDRDPNAAWSAWRAEHGPADLDVRKGPRFDSSDLVLLAANAGLGVALARGRLAADAVRSGALVRPFGDLQVELPDAYWIVRPRLRSANEAVDTVVRWLRRQPGAESPLFDG